MHKYSKTLCNLMSISVSNNFQDLIHFKVVANCFNLFSLFTPISRISKMLIEQDQQLNQLFTFFGVNYYELIALMLIDSISRLSNYKFTLSCESSFRHQPVNNAHSPE